MYIIEILPSFGHNHMLHTTQILKITQKVDLFLTAVIIQLTVSKFSFKAS